MLPGHSDNRNVPRGKLAEINKPESKVKIYVIPTNEELMIARDTKEIISGLKLKKSKLDENELVEA